MFVSNFISSTLLSYKTS